MLILTILMVLGIPARTAAGGTLHIDMADGLGAATHRYSGFLYSWWTGKAPPAWGLKDLKPQTWRVGYWGTWDSEYPSMVGAGVQQVQIIVSDAYRNRGATLINGHSHDPSWESKSFVDIAAEIAAMVKSKGWSRAAFDIENEPDVFRADDWSAGPPAWYRDEYLPSVRKIREILPGAVIVGPSYFSYKEGNLRKFLAQARADGVLPSIFSFHFLEWNPRILQKTADAARAMMAGLGLDLPISINEVFEPGHCGFVQEAVLYLAQAERARLDSMMHASWDDMGDGSTGDNPCFDCLLTIPGQQTRPAYFVYAFYASMSGKMVGLTPADSGSGASGFDGLASSDPASKTARVLFGGDSGSARLVFSNLGSASYLGDAVHVRVDTVSSGGNGHAPISGPGKQFEGDLPVASNALTVDLDNLAPDAAYLVTLTPVNAPPPSTIPDPGTNEPSVNGGSTAPPSPSPSTPTEGNAVPANNAAGDSPRDTAQPAPPEASGQAAGPADADLRFVGGCAQAPAGSPPSDPLCAALALIALVWTARRRRRRKPGG